MRGKTPGHVAISASAGSGKTFQLAHRYIQLLALGARPEQLVALTFSRKAAGEIFDSIIGHLCTAAGSETQAHALATRVGIDSLTQSDCMKLLRVLVDNLHRLHVGTIDSFTVGILRSFPLELSIPPAFQLTDSESAEAAAVRQRILDDMSRTEGDAEDTRRSFAAAFQQANLGRLGKQVEQSIAGFISRYQSAIRALPAGDVWGQATAIWPEGSPWLSSTIGISEAASNVRRLVAALTLPAEAEGRWQQFVTAVERYTPNSRWSKDISYLFEKLAGCLDDLLTGSATVKLNRTPCGLDGELARGVLVLVGHIVKTDITAALSRTRGIHQTLAAYERRYEQIMRRDGILTFADIQFLLTGASQFGDGKRLSSLGADASRLYIDYRLDSHLDHWLLDEFQDTSDLQWEALRNLIEEVLQDESGRRTLFYVGDVKQAIYGWRGGNPYLFRMLIDTYGDVIEQRTLEASHRSCQAIIDTVNRVFGDLRSTPIPPGAVALWQRFWQPHTCAPEVPGTGCAALIEPSPALETTSLPSSDDRYQVVAQLLREIDPLARGLSTAILVRSNDQGRALVDYLRGECPGNVIIHEGRAAIKDNPLVAVLLSLVAFAAHPGDTYAWRHLQMSPMLQALEALGLNCDSLSLHLLRQVQTHGFQHTLRLWANRIDAVERIDAFGRIRLEQLLAAAGEFDARGDLVCDAFLNHIEQYELHEAAADDAIRVMTVHQAKGLGFDLVILPELDRYSLEHARDVDFILSRDPDTQAAVWALETPRRIVAECDDVLRAELEEIDSRESFESLCLLYVAMTRAKQGLYVVTSAPPRSSTVFNQSTLVREQLSAAGDTSTTELSRLPGGATATYLYCHGDGRWFDSMARKQMVSPSYDQAHGEPRLADRPSTRREMIAVLPSDADGLEASAAELFNPNRQLRLSVGAAVHELFQHVSWHGESDVAALLSEWLSRTELAREVTTAAIEHFQRAMSSRHVQAALTRPPANPVLWREHRFDVVLENAWISGSFDRVVLERNAADRPVRARILDFKTDEVEASGAIERAQTYRQQMLLYRTALERIASLPRERIALELVFTSPGIVIHID